MNKTYQDIERIVELHARRYRARCPWVTLDDLRQAGWVAALETLPKYDEGRGPLQPFLYRPICWAMGALARQQRYPVSAGQGHGADMHGVVERDSLATELWEGATGGEAALLRRELARLLYEIADSIDPSGVALEALTMRDEGDAGRWSKLAAEHGLTARDVRSRATTVLHALRRSVEVQDYCRAS